MAFDFDPTALPGWLRLLTRAENVQPPPGERPTSGKGLAREAGLLFLRMRFRWEDPELTRQGPKSRQRLTRGRICA
jgi:hypothetical protein